MDKNRGKPFEANACLLNPERYALNRHTTRHKLFSDAIFVDSGDMGDRSLESRIAIQQNPSSPFSSPMKLSQQVYRSLLSLTSEFLLAEAPVARDERQQQQQQMFPAPEVPRAAAQACRLSERRRKPPWPTRRKKKRQREKLPRKTAACLKELISFASKAASLTRSHPLEDYGGAREAKTTKDEPSTAYQKQKKDASTRTLPTQRGFET